MRTTLTLDPDVAAMLKKAVAKGDATFKDVVNEALRRGLAGQPPGSPKRRFVQRVGPPGEFLVDINNNGALWEMWDEEDYGDLRRRESPRVRD